MKYVILKLEEDITDIDPRQLAVSIGWAHGGRGFTVLNRNDYGQIANVIGVIPVLRGGRTEQAIDANLTDPKEIDA